MSQILDAIDGALERKGISAAKASQMAVGHPSLIKNLRSGQGRFSFESLRRLAEVLDLECYFGPPIHDGSRRHDGSSAYSGEPQPAPLGPLLRARLQLDDDATEADAVARIDLLPGSAHEQLTLVRRISFLETENARLVDELRGATMAVKQLSAALFEVSSKRAAELLPDGPPQESAAPPPIAPPKRRKAPHDPTNPAHWVGGGRSSTDKKD